MPKVIRPNQADGDFWEIAEYEKHAIPIRVSGGFSLSDPKKLGKYIDKLKRAHAYLKSQTKGKRK